MKNKAIVLLVLGLMGSMGMRGQRALDTLQVNEFKNVALFFPSPIERAVTGHKGFVFSYDRERAGHVGLLQGVEGPDSNLLVITADGLVYAYILTYAKETPRLNLFVNLGEHLESVRPIPVRVPLTIKSKKDSVLTAELAQGFLHTPSKTLARNRKRGVVFRLEAMEYIGNEVYLVCGLKNRSGIDFEINYLDVLLVNGSKKRRASHQEISLEIKQTMELPETLEHGLDIRFVIVLPKFVLGDKERLQIILREMHGNRVIRINY